MSQPSPRHPSQPRHRQVALKLQKRLAQKGLDPALRRFLQSQLKLVRALAKLPKAPGKPSLPKPRQPNVRAGKPDLSNLPVRSPGPEASVSQQLLNRGRPPLKLKALPRQKVRLRKQ